MTGPIGTSYLSPTNTNPVNNGTLYSNYNIVPSINTTFNLGFNGVTPATNLFWNNIYANQIFATGSIRAKSFIINSDYRIKKNVTALDNNFHVDYLRPVTYINTQTNTQDVGLIAHELQKYYPDLVIGEKDGPEIQSVNYVGLIPILINEIKNLKNKNTVLENEIKNIKDILEKNGMI